MLIGIQKRQWLLILLTLSVPLLINAVAIWQDIGTASILKIWNGTYKPSLYLVAYNPLPEISLKLLLFTVALGLLAWLMVFISNKAFFQKQLLIAKFCETLLMAWLVAVVFDVVTGFFMPLVWLPIFHDYLLGLPVSSFMLDWSRWLVLPTTALILFIAIFLSGNKKIDTPSITA